MKVYIALKYELLIIPLHVSKSTIARTEAKRVTKSGKSLLTAREPPKMKLNSVSKKLLLARMLILCCQESVPAPTKSSFTEKPINILRSDKDASTINIIFPDSATRKV
jgi:hypothetical protein